MKWFILAMVLLLASYFLVRSLLDLSNTVEDHEARIEKLETVDLAATLEEVSELEAILVSLED